MTGCTHLDNQYARGRRPRSAGGFHSLPVADTEGVTGYRPLVRRLFIPSEALRGRPCVTRCMTSTGPKLEQNNAAAQAPSVLATKGPAGQTEPFRRVIG